MKSQAHFFVGYLIFDEGGRRVYRLLPSQESNKVVAYELDAARIIQDTAPGSSIFKIVEIKQ